MRTAKAKRRMGAFTLIEVVLAIVIAIGLLVVALYFYQQTAEVRVRLVEESERLSTVRLLLDRLTADLRTACVEPRLGFTGGGDFMKMTCLAGPGRPGGTDPGLRLVSYHATAAVEGTNRTVTGFARMETPLVEFRSSATNLVAATNLVVALTNAAVGVEGSTSQKEEPLTSLVHFVRFRYWDGSAWQEAWDSVDLPPGVEVSLGFEPLGGEDHPDDYGHEQFRRVIHVPAGRAKLDPLGPLGSAPTQPGRER